MFKTKKLPITHVAVAQLSISENIKKNIKR
jgi:hypothetical protein